MKQLKRKHKAEKAHNKDLKKVRDSDSEDDQMSDGENDKEPELKPDADPASDIKVFRAYMLNVLTSNDLD